MLSNTCKYGLRALAYLALHADEKKIGIKKISGDLDIPTPFLGKILQNLAKHKIIDSTKGPSGGFGLNKNTLDTKLIDIVQIIDGSEFFSTCMLGLRACSSSTDDTHCAIHHKYNKLRDEVFVLFSNETIGSLSQDICSVFPPIKI